MVLGRSGVESSDRENQSSIISGVYADGDSNGGTWSAKLDRIDNVVSMTILATSNFTQDTGNVTTATTALPVEFRPPATRVCPVLLHTAGADAAGRVEVGTNGFIGLRVPAGTTVTLVCGFISGSVITYTV